MRANIISYLLLTCAAASNAQDQTGKIVFYREPHFASGDFKPALYCDDIELAQIENGTYFQVTAPAGLHKCTVETSQRPVIEVNVLEGKTAYAHVELKPGFRDHAALANTTEDEYSKRKGKLKPLKEWSRTALELHSHQRERIRLNRAELESFITVANTGKGVICAEFNVTLNTSFGLQYRGAFGRAPKMKEMLPGESAEGSYVFDIKDGVQPLELMISLKSRRYDDGGRSSLGNIRCGSDFPFRDVFVSDEIRLNVRDLPIALGPSQ